MYTLKSYTVAIFIVFVTLFGCSDEVDETKPTVDLTYENTFPQNCDSVRAGESFNLIIKCTDNEALSSYSIQIHPNFDHHGHTTEFGTCQLDPVKEGSQIINPYTFKTSIPIPELPVEYITNLVVDIPEDADTGDYHLQLTAIDNSGWSSFVILAIKVLPPN